VVNEGKALRLRKKGFFQVGVRKKLERATGSDPFRREAEGKGGGTTRVSGITCRRENGGWKGAQGANSEFVRRSACSGGAGNWGIEVT